MTINLRKITQGERGTLTFTWEFPETLTSPASISGATITATMTDEDGVTTAVSGTLTGTAATVCTWALSAGDSGTAGTFTVLFKAVATGVTTYTLEATLEVITNPSVTGTQNDPLVSISAADAAWVALATTAVPDGGDIIPDAPSDGTQYARQDGDWAVVNSVSDVEDLTTAGLTAANMLRVAAAGGLEERTPAQVLADIGADAAGAAAARVAKAGDTMSGQLIIDATNSEALLVRKGSDSGDVFRVDTATAGKVFVFGNLEISAGKQLLTDDGSAAVPSVTFGNDLNCGMYRIGVDNIGFAAGGQNAFECNVLLFGIGTERAGVTMAAKLDVYQWQNAGAIPVLRLSQLDVSEEIVEIDSVAGVGNAIELVGAKSLTVTEFIKVTINGNTRYIAAGTIA